jgi:uncharacterized membrane protein
MYETLFKSHDVRRVLIITALMFWSTCLIALRVERTGSRYYLFLIWNLFLAGIPLVASTGLRLARRWRFPLIIQAGCFGFWLLFLPNAPYILTDLLHLTASSPAPAWYDLALLLSCAGTGLLLGYLSLMDVHDIVAKNLGTAIGWALALSSLLLTGFAIYLGRFLRWNSWDVLTRPSILFDMADGLLHPASHFRTFSVTLVYGILLGFGYITLRVLMANPNVPHPGTSKRKEAM